MATATDELQTLDEPIVSPEDGRYECINGLLVEKPSMGTRSSAIAFDLMLQLQLFVKASRLGRCFGENVTYRIFPADPRKSRIPDGSFVRAGRLPDGRIPAGEMKIAPDLAVEVVSPNDGVENLFERINDLIGAGVRLLWVIVPATRQVFVHRADGSVSRLTESEALSGEDVIPGFTYRIADLFDVE